jgi:hypothetical protein
MAAGSRSHSAGSHARKPVSVGVAAGIMATEIGADDIRAVLRNRPALRNLRVQRRWGKQASG